MKNSFIKKTFFVFMILFVYHVSAYAASNKTDSNKTIEIKCKLSTKKDRRIFKKGKKIDFMLMCSTDDSEYMFMPFRFFSGSADFNPHIIMENEDGVQYEFLYYKYALLIQDSIFKIAKSGSTIFDFRFPDEKEKYRIVDKKEWDKTESYQIKEREDIFDNALETIPPGKYNVWVDFRHEWKTIKIGRTFLILENYNNYDNRADIMSWEINDITPKIELNIVGKKDKPKQKEIFRN